MAAGGFGLVALDFGEQTPAVPTAAWLRLRRLSGAPGTVVLVVSPRPLQGVMGAVTVAVQQAQPRFDQPPGRRGPRRADGPAPALLQGLEIRALLSRQTGGRGRGSSSGELESTLTLLHAL